MTAEEIQAMIAALAGVTAQTDTSRASAANAQQQAQDSLAKLYKKRQQEAEKKAKKLSVAGMLGKAATSIIPGPIDDMLLQPVINKAAGSDASWGEELMSAGANTLIPALGGKLGEWGANELRGMYQPSLEQKALASQNALNPNGTGGPVDTSKPYMENGRYVWPKGVDKVDLSQPLIPSNGQQQAPDNSIAAMLGGGDATGSVIKKPFVLKMADNLEGLGSTLGSSLSGMIDVQRVKPAEVPMGMSAGTVMKMDDSQRQAAIDALRQKEVESNIVAKAADLKLAEQRMGLEKEKFNLEAQEAPLRREGMDIQNQTNRYNLTDVLPTSVAANKNAIKNANMSASEISAAEDARLVQQLANSKQIAEGNNATQLQAANISAAASTANTQANIAANAAQTDKTIAANKSMRFNDNVYRTMQTMIRAKAANGGMTPEQRQVNNFASALTQHADDPVKVASIRASIPAALLPQVDALIVQARTISDLETEQDVDFVDGILTNR